MYLLTTFQEKAVNQLLTYTYESLTYGASQTAILLESPTGSGKTVMMAAYLERLIDELPLQPDGTSNVAFIWFAPNTLHIQSFESLQDMYADTRKLRCMDLSHLTNNPVLNPCDLLFVNWSSVDSLKKIWRRDNEQNINLETLIVNTKQKGTKLILVIDEAHLSAFSGPQAIEVRKLIAANIEISVTATPLKRPQRTVFISRQEAIQAQMIKKGVRLNIDLDPKKQNDEGVTSHLLRTAFDKKKELAAWFAAEIGENQLNPLILIQLPSDNSALTEEDKTIRNTITHLLATDYDITTQNGRLAIWLSGEKDTDGLEKMNGLQDVLIFKQAIAQGWNCPRACILLSYRNVQSPDFGIQTVGRILRMPHQKHYQTDDLNYGYVYTNMESSRINFVPSDIDYFNMQVATRQDDKGWVYESLLSSVIINDRATPGELSNAFKSIFFNEMEQRYGIVQLPEINLLTPENEEDLPRLKAINWQAMCENGWEFEIDPNQIHLPVNIEVDSYEVNARMIDSHEMKAFAITTAEFETYFNRFCYDSLTRYNRSKSLKFLAQALVEFAEYYLNINQYAAWKFFLFPQNKTLLVPHITAALERFVEKENSNRRPESQRWQVPKERYYNDLYKAEELANHALIPFFEYKNASSVEKTFKQELLNHTDALEWWYKNGDKGREHFAISYRNLQGELRLFYVDFVIKFKSGKIGLFDTKTKRSDLDAPQKHNALIDYIEQENKTNPTRKLIGGIIIPEESAGVISFRYCTNRITDTADLRGWDFFLPANI